MTGKNLSPGESRRVRPLNAGLPHGTVNSEVNFRKKRSLLPFGILLAVICLGLSLTYFLTRKPGPSGPSSGAASIISDVRNDTDKIRRQQFVNALQRAAAAKGESIIFSVEGAENRTLAIKSDVMQASDCPKESTADDGTSAGKIGFNQMICRNIKTNEQWTFVIAP